MQRRKTFPWGKTLIGIAVIGAAIYYGPSLFSGAPEVPKGPPPAHVDVVTAEMADLPLFFQYSARLAGSREVEIRPRVGGILLKRNYTEGQYVKQGAVLFQIDPAPYEASLAQAKASFAQAEKDWRRAQGLKRDRAISPRELDQAQASYGETKAALETAKINLGYTTVRAPVSGYTSEEDFSEGSLVAADTSLLTRVTQLDPIYVEFSYPDREANMQRAGLSNGSLTMPKDGLLKAELHLESGDTYPIEGDIRFTDSIIDVATGTVRARAVLPNKDAHLLPGQFARVVVKGFMLKDAIAIPEKAVMQSPQGTFVYVVDAEDKAKMTPVTLGQLNRGRQVVTSGLNAGDRIITEGMIKVAPDAQVVIDTGTPEAPATEAAKAN